MPRASHEDEQRDITARPNTFEAFYAAEARSVLIALAVTLGRDDLAEEATAEAMARAYAMWPKVRSYQNPGGWVYRVGLNWAISRLRWERFRSSRPVDDRIDGASHVDRTGLAEDIDLKTAIRQLPLRSRTVIVLRYHWGLSQEEIAGVLGVPLGTVKSRISRALSALRQELEDE